MSDNKKIKFYLKDNPSKGLINYKKYPNFNKDTDFYELEGLTYQNILELDKLKSLVNTRLHKLLVLINNLIPNDLLSLPLCDMFYVMTQVSLLSGLDMVNDGYKYEKSIKNNEPPPKIKPYFLPNVICPNCGKIHSKIPFSLDEIVFMGFEEDLIVGKRKWRDLIVFNNFKDNVVYQFEYPSINKFKDTLSKFLDLYNIDDEDYHLNLKLVSLAATLTKKEDNTIFNIEDSINNLKELFTNMTGGDAMKLEMIYSNLIQPVAFINFKCDCEQGSFVIDISYTITDILRLLFANKERIVHEIYTFSTDNES